MRERLFEIIRKEFRQAFREPRMRVHAVSAAADPAVDFRLRGQPGRGSRPASPGWTATRRTKAANCWLLFKGSGRFEVTAAPASDREVQALLDSSKVDLVVRVLPGFARDLHRGRTAPVQILVNGTNSNTAIDCLQLREFDRRPVCIRSDGAAEPATAWPRSNDSRRRSPARAAGIAAEPRLVQSGAEEPQLLRAGHRGEHHHAGDADAHRHGDRAGKGNRHHGAADGDAHPADRADARQDTAVCDGGSGEHGHRGRSRHPPFRHSLPRQRPIAVRLLAPVPDDVARRRACLSPPFRARSSRP